MKPKVFMLGWEYPPFLNGGLGVASMGLGEALSDYARVKMVVPHSDSPYSGNLTRLTGLNELDLDELWKKTRELDYEKLKKVRLAHVDVRLSGYEFIDEEMLPADFEAGSLFVRKEQNIHERQKSLESFKIVEPYGQDLLERVKDYTEICVRLAQHQEFDLIHAHDWMTFLAGLEIKAMYDRPLVLHVHSLEYDRTSPKNKGWVYQLEKHAMEVADAIIPVSHYTAGIISKHYGITPEKIFPVHNGIGLKEAEIGDTENPFPEKIVVFLGRIAAQKGPDLLVEAAVEVLKKNHEVRFVIAGEGDMLSVVTEQVAKNRLGNHIHFTGFLTREETRKLLAMADLFVMPSISEPFGLVALEAAQMGVPSIISKFSGVAEVLADAIKVDPSDTLSLAAQINNQLIKPRTKREMADLSLLSWDAAAKKVSKIYQMLLG